MRGGRRWRGIALTRAEGLARGAPAVSTGHPLRVPDGERVLGRVFDVQGRAIDRKEPVTGGEWRPFCLLVALHPAMAG